jgi:hypothetical protein
LKENTQKQPRESAIRAEEQERLSKKVEPETRRDLSREILQVLTKYGGRSPHFISKVLGVDEVLVVANLKELQKQGKILLRTPNMKWKTSG